MTVRHESWLQKHPRRVWGIVVALMAIFGFLTRVPVIKDWFDWFINANTQVKNIQPGALIVSKPVFFTVSLLLFFVIVTGFILLIGEIRARRSTAEAPPSGDLEAISEENR